MRNRYSDLLQEFNEEILLLSPANRTLWQLAVHKFLSIYQPEKKVLEIGCGSGDSAAPILQASNANLDLIDVSPGVIEAAQEKLRQYATRVKFICADAHKYLQDSGNYDIIYSSFTIHNFLRDDRINLCRSIFDKLNHGGEFLLVDIVPSNGADQWLLNAEIDRYKCLPPPVRRAMTRHVLRDATDPYRMEEEWLLSNLRRAGFRKVRVLHRIERSILLSARKPASCLNSKRRKTGTRFA